MRVMAKMLCLSHLICLILSLCLVDATIEIYDHFGKKIDSFKDREAFDDDFLTMEGFLTAAVPSDACTAVEPPSYLTNFTMSKFLLVNNSDVCIFTTKVNNAEKAGYDVVIMYDSSPTPYQYIRFVPFPRIEFDIQLVFVSFEDGMILRNNYLYNNSFAHNYRIKLKPNTPDITYYMYLFGAVIGVCFFVMLLFMTCLLIKCIQERRKLRQRRLSRRQLNQIPTAKFSKGDQFDVCAICLEDYNEGDKLRILPCSHAYHSKCIDPWLMNNRRNCPLCKRKIMFGDSGDESDSEDSELASPAENTPLLNDARRRRAYWMTFSNTPAQGDGGGPSIVGATNPTLSPSSEMSSEDRSLAEALLQRGRMWRAYDIMQRQNNPEQADGSGPSNVVETNPFSDISSENPFLWEDDTESLLPPAHSSVNNGANNIPTTSEPDAQRVIVVFTGEVVEDSASNEQQRGLII